MTNSVDIKNVDLLTNVQIMQSAPRLEWSSFFAEGKALAKKSGNGRRKKAPKLGLRVGAFNSFAFVLMASIFFVTNNFYFY
ncbi:hypothetical protein IO89_14350 [Epilithonimonas lactis]|uniref:Transmembrane protein n=1 Tax=Epilithonimonas lactis TaxID=421072 RepID=A0A085BFW9_9FLAO|nr:hypothetical protein IO89_14350 [Epilithonimonas lactis]